MESNLTSTVKNGPVAGQPANGDLTTMDKIAWMQENCCAVYITVNGHRTLYQKPSEHLPPSLMGDVPDDVLATMDRLDRIVQVQVYPDTPVGSHVAFHHDLDQAVDEVYQAIMAERRTP